MSDLLRAAGVSISLGLLGAGAGWMLSILITEYKKARRRVDLADLIIDVPEHARCACCHVSLTETGGIKVPAGVVEIGGTLIEFTVCVDCYMHEVAA